MAEFPDAEREPYPEVRRPSWWMLAALGLAVVGIIWAAASAGSVKDRLDRTGEVEQRAAATTSPADTADGPQRAGVPTSQGEVHVEVSAACQVASTPLRDFAAANPSALGLGEAASNVLSEALSGAASGCTPEEYKVLVNLEFRDWLMRPPVPDNGS